MTYEKILPNSKGSNMERAIKDVINLMAIGYLMDIAIEVSSEKFLLDQRGLRLRFLEFIAESKKLGKPYWDKKEKRWIKQNGTLGKMFRKYPRTK